MHGTSNKQKIKELTSKGLSRAQIQACSSRSWHLPCHLRSWDFYSGEEPWGSEELAVDRAECRPSLALPWVTWSLRVPPLPCLKPLTRPPTGSDCRQCPISSCEESMLTALCDNLLGPDFKAGATHSHYPSNWPLPRQPAWDRVQDSGRLLWGKRDVLFPLNSRTCFYNLDPPV